MPPKQYPGKGSDLVSAACDRRSDPLCARPRSSRTATCLAEPVVELTKEIARSLLAVRHRRRGGIRVRMSNDPSTHGSASVGNDCVILYSSLAGLLPCGEVRLSIKVMRSRHRRSNGEIFRARARIVRLLTCLQSVPIRVRVHIAGFTQRSKQAGPVGLGKAVQATHCGYCTCRSLSTRRRGKLGMCKG